MALFTHAELPRVQAVQALLVYEDQTIQDGTRYALTTHEITQSPTGLTIGTGRLLGQRDQQMLLDILLGALATESTFLPAEIVCHSSACLAWVVRGAVRPMWFRFGHDSHRLTVPWPNLVFCARRNRLYLASYKTSGRPGPTTPLYHAPLMNVHGDTALCSGNAQLPAGWSLAHRPDYERVVFETYFTHVNHDRTLKLAKHRVSTARQFRFWRELHQHKTSRFPTQALVPLHQTAAQWLSDG